MSATFPNTFEEALQLWEAERARAISGLLDQTPSNSARWNLGYCLETADWRVSAARLDITYERELDDLSFSAAGADYRVLKVKTRMLTSEWVRERLTIIRYKTPTRYLFDSETLLFREVSNSRGEVVLESISNRISDRTVVSAEAVPGARFSPASKQTISDYLYNYAAVAEALQSAVLDKYPDARRNLRRETPGAEYDLPLETEIGPPIVYDIPLAGIDERFVDDLTANGRNSDGTVTRLADKTIFTSGELEYVFHKPQNGVALITMPGGTEDPTEFAVRGDGPGRIWVVARGARAATHNLDPWMARFAERIASNPGLSA